MDPSALPFDPNAVQFDAASAGDHVESYFLKANDPAGERAVWIKATIFSTSREPERPLAEAWAIAFDRRSGTNRHVAVKHSLPFAESMFRRDGLGVRWALGPSGESTRGEGIRIERGRTEGLVSLREHRVGWELELRGDAPPILPFPYAAMYRGSFPKSKLVTPSPDLRFSGVVEVDGESWELDGWRGMQGHNWGRGHADLYAWCHVNQWEDEPELVLEGFSGRVRVGPLTTPLVTLVCVRHRGVRYDFDRPLTVARAHGEVGPRRWSFAAESRHARIEGEVEASTEDMVGLHYPNPDGAMTYCLNSKLARARVRFEPRGRAPLELRSRAAALEIGTRDAGHGVRMYV